MFSKEFMKNREDEDPTMIPYFDLIREMNQRGFLTTNSQAGHVTEDVVERAYVCGAMLAKDAPFFLNHLSISSDKVVGEVLVSKTDTLPIPVTLVRGEPHTFVRFSMFPEEALDEFLTLGIPEEQRKEFIFIACFDTTWGRDARDALFHDVIVTLKMLCDSK